MAHYDGEKERGREGREGERKSEREIDKSDVGAQRALAIIHRRAAQKAEYGRVRTTSRYLPSLLREAITPGRKWRAAT